MRKQLATRTGGSHRAGPLSGDQWLNLDALASVEVTSENREFPIENALLPARESPWRAAEPGEQTIRLLFDQPQPVHRIRLQFDNPYRECTQEFVVRWAAHSEGPFQEIVRQQWNFSPPNSVRELEDYRVNLDKVSVLELSITPDIRDPSALASLSQMRLA
jgi:hypothetical protein